MTVTDEDEVNPRVNLVLNVQESTSAIMEDLPIKGLDISASADIEPPVSPIPRRKRSAVELHATMSNGHGDRGTNDKESAHGAANDREFTGTKRSADDDVETKSTELKRPKVQPKGAPVDDDLILVDDSTDGAILIDDD